MGAGATGIGIAATRAMGDTATFESIVQLSKIIGLPLHLGGQKSYLFGQLLVGDEFQAWGKTITPWVVSGDETPQSEPPTFPTASLACFHIITSLVGCALLGLSMRWVGRCLTKVGK